MHESNLEYSISTATLNSMNELGTPKNRPCKTTFSLKESLWALMLAFGNVDPFSLRQKLVRAEVGRGHYILRHS